MNSDTSYKREAVLAALRPDAVLDQHGVKFHHSGDELRTRICPVCGDRSRDAVAIHSKTGRWIDHAHGCAGDLLALVAGYAGLDIKRDFRAVILAAAEIAGIAPSSSALIRMPVRPQVSVTDHDRIAAVASVPERWLKLLRRSHAGEGYLRGRGIDPKLLIERDLVRFTEAGDVVVQLFDLEAGRPNNLVTRRRVVAEDAPKVIGLRFCPTSGSLVQPVRTIEEGRDVAVLCEGLMDTLAAVTAFPTCVAVGAHGAGRLVELSAVVTPLIVAVRGWVLMVPHDDDVGTQSMGKAATAAIEAGLVLDETLLLVDLGQHKDLADAVRAGWSYPWPS